MKSAKFWGFKMNAQLKKGLATGVERLSAWEELLDTINVYPIADGDTGRNLKISLSPLIQPDTDMETTLRSLLFSARGNSGNIAARFFSGFLKSGNLDNLAVAAKHGRDSAWKAVNDPREGTMLTVFDALAEVLEKETGGLSRNLARAVIDHLEDAVHSTTEILPRLKEANVVDSGALGMYIFFEGFFNELTGGNSEYRPIMKIFKDKLKISSSFTEQQDEQFCVDTVLRIEGDSEDAVKKLAETDSSIVMIKENGLLKVHFHTDDKDGARRKLESFGSVVKWEADNLAEQVRDFKKTEMRQAIHIMTDAAGSVTGTDARNLGLTLLDSYIMCGDRCVPETHMTQELLYDSMEKGIKASTSQASEFERHQHYESVLSRHGRVLYLCVGSVYTGNYDTAIKWKELNDPDGRFTIIDTGTASGKLGTIAITTARRSMASQNPDDVIAFAKKAVEQCEEYIFLEMLHYLAAGGRMSKTGAFFGDMLNVKPIISPLKDGASKAGIARNTNDQLKFLRKKMAEKLTAKSRAFIMIEYTNNRSWIINKVKPEVEKLYPLSEIIIQPLSLTTGVHTGPGTWGVAFLDVDNI